MILRAVLLVGHEYYLRGASAVKGKIDVKEGIDATRWQSLASWHPFGRATKHEEMDVSTSFHGASKAPIPKAASFVEVGVDRAPALG
jgi:hypothetical protein